MIIVEGFATDEHIELVRRQLPEGTLESHFFLWCDPDIAVQRKHEDLDEATVMDQFARYTRHYPTRIRIDTSSGAAADFASEIALQVNQSSAETPT